MLTWYAVQTKPRQEATAELNLERQGYNTYLPKILLRKRRRDKWNKVVEPLFPRYLFIQVDTKHQSLAPVRSTVGVAALVRFGRLLRPVPNNVIDYIKRAENPETHQHRADACPHQPGDEVCILEGPFTGLTGIFQAQTGEERAMVLLELLGRQNTVQVQMDAIA
jgi:transcriptional antiterminator RfaH